MSTDSQLKVIHVFPSEESYNTNKGSVGVDDLSLVPLKLAEIASKLEAEAGTDNTKMMTPLRVAEVIVKNSNGIIAQSLGQNGYVKFANGLILQWGTPTIRGNNKFPLSFPNRALAITSASVGGWVTVSVEIVDNDNYSVLGWATDVPTVERTILPNIIAIGF